ncbi:hypothetical protein L596_011432 [Steinernema carpocapsae]|uniref:CRIB domain-containing protein n=1 Tax=Steinernema carpocapsae TaxID=34508 RepID=A0A4U5NTV6_STECR|nr:hypothetical protein L596_011432 [Steinernema carpocapsae]
MLSETSFKGFGKRRRKLSVKTGRDEQRPGDRRSALPISGPSDFVHIVHMGPGAGLELQNLIDLKNSTSNSLNTSGSSNQQNSPSPADRVRQIINPIMRSTSSSSAATNSVQQLGGTMRDIERIQKSRPVSSHSRSSEGSIHNSTPSSEGRFPVAPPPPGNGDNYYLEPISRTQMKSPPSFPPPQLSEMIPPPLRRPLLQKYQQPRTQHPDREHGQFLRQHLAPTRADLTTPQALNL